MRIGNTADIISLINCIELLLDTCQYQQNLLCEIAENQGISIGPGVDEKLDKIRNRINVLTPWRRLMQEAEL